MGHKDFDCARFYRLLNGAVANYAEAAGVEDLERYFIPLCQQDINRARVPNDGQLKPEKITEQTMMEQFARSLQNGRGTVNLIKFDKWTGDGEDRRYEYRDRVARCTGGFDPNYIVDLCKDDKGNVPYEPLHALLEEAFPKASQPEEGAIESTAPKVSRGNLEKYARGLYDAARFIMRPIEDDSEESGCDWVNKALAISCDNAWDDDGKADIPRRLQSGAKGSRIHGLGPALSRDFLKECGCIWLSKPDSHLVSVLSSFGLIDKLVEVGLTEKQANVFCEKIYCSAKTAREELGDPRITPYRVDKMLWLLCTGNFYFDEMPEKLSYRDTIVSSMTRAALKL